MKYSSLLLVILLSLTLILNIVLITKINNLESKINYLQGETRQLKSAVTSVPGQLNNFLNQIKQSESWHTPVRLNIGDPKPDKIELTANWQIKDYQKGAEVTFHYQPPGSEFKEIKAASNEKGYFEVKFPITVELKPEWRINISNSQKPNRISEKITGRNSNLKYYISIESEEKIKSSKIRYHNLTNLGYKLYGPLHVSLDINNEDNYHLSLSTPKNLNHEIKIKEVRLKTYNNQQLISTADLEYTPNPDGKSGGYHLSYHNKARKINRLVLEVKYSNGKEFKKEIYRKF